MLVLKKFRVSILFALLFSLSCSLSQKEESLRGKEQVKVDASVELPDSSERFPELSEKQSEKESTLNDLVCMNLPDKYYNYMQKSRFCKVDSDCHLLGNYKGDCECMHIFGGSAGVGVARSRAEGALKLINLYFSERCKPYRSERCLKDEFPASSVKCLKNICRRVQKEGCRTRMP